MARVRAVARAFAREGARFFLTGRTLRQGTPLASVPIEEAQDGLRGGIGVLPVHYV